MRVPSLSPGNTESEACYRAVFDQAAVGIARVAPNGTFLEVNDAFCEIVGYARERLMQGDFQQITHPDDLDVDLANVAHLLAGETTSYAMEKRYLRPDGTIVWVALHVGLVRDAAGRPSNFVSVVQDISDSKQAEQMLTEYSARLEILSRQLLSVQEEERRALARELHDHVGQQLAALKLNLEALRVRHANLAVEPRFVDSLEIIDQTHRSDRRHVARSATVAARRLWALRSAPLVCTAAAGTFGVRDHGARERRTAVAGSRRDCRLPHRPGGRSQRDSPRSSDARVRGPRARRGRLDCERERRRFRIRSGIDADTGSSPERHGSSQHA